MKFLSLFSGIGGMDHGFIRAGWECVGFAELDKYAHRAFEILHNKEGYLKGEFDVRNIGADYLASVGTVDAIVGGFPCQAFSIAGKREGFADQTRGTLFFEIVRIVEIAKPTYLVLENVKGLLSHDGGRTFEVILSALDELGYDCEWQVLNSKDFNVPQNRERVFIIGCARGSTRPKVFPIIRQSEGTIEVVGLLDIKGKDQIRRIYSPNHLAPCLSTMQGGGQQPKILIDAYNQKIAFGHGKLSPTLTSECGHKSSRTGVKVLVSVNQHEAKEQENAHCLDANYYKGLLANQARTGVLQDYRIRKLTPLECFRLQSYPDEWYFKLKEHGFSDTQLYKMAGNGVTSNVAYEIANRLFIIHAL